METPCSPPLSLLTTGVIPEECAQMTNLVDFKVGSMPDLTSKSGGIMNIAYAIESGKEAACILCSQSPNSYNTQGTHENPFFRYHCAVPGNARIPSTFNQWIRNRKLEKDLGRLKFASSSIEFAGDQGLDGLKNFGDQKCIILLLQLGNVCWSTFFIMS